MSRIPFWWSFVFGLLTATITLGTVRADETSSSLMADTSDKVYGSGFVFCEGQYITPPYVIRLQSKSMSINDREFDQSVLDLQGFEEEIALDSPELVEAYQGDASVLLMFQELKLALSLNGVVVLTKGMPPTLIDQPRSVCDFFIALRNRSGYAFIPSVSEVSDSKGRWSNLWSGQMAGLETTPALLQRVNPLISRLDVVEAENEQIIAANLWVNTLSYPLTMFAMVVVVFSFGHLLQNKPVAEQAAFDDTSHVREIVARSLTIMALLSLVDLVWTIAAYQTGAMREMNPIGNRFIHDPYQLAAFKAVMVVTAIALLYRFQQRPIAQLASWWCCLVLTLVTARWLTFSSLFLT